MGGINLIVGIREGFLEEVVYKLGFMRWIEFIEKEKSLIGVFSRGKRLCYYWFWSYIKWGFEVRRI